MDRPREMTITIRWVERTEYGVWKQDGSNEVVLQPDATNLERAETYARLFHPGAIVLVRKTYRPIFSEHPSTVRGEWERVDPE